MNTATILYSVVTFFISNNIFTIKGCNTVEHYNNSDHSAEINVTAWSKETKVHYRIIDVDVTWSQAVDICESLKYGSLSSGIPGWVTRTNVRNYLEGINYKNLNYTFWMRGFRPYVHVQKWYSSTKSCKEIQYINSIENNNEGRCVAIKRNESEFHKETLFVDNCKLRKPFVCTNFFGCIDLLAYNGYDVFETPTGATERYLFNVTLDYCKTKCINDSTCNSFSYVNLSESCTYFKRNSGYGVLNYTIYKSNNSDVTHYVKTGSIMEYISNVTHIPIPTDTQDLPNCGIDEIPPSYCPCQADPENDIAKIEDIVSEIIHNLTIDKKETSAYKRKVSSSTDERNVSKAFGAFGLIIIIGTLSLFVMSDVSSHVSRMTGKTKKKKIKKYDQQNEDKE